MFSLKHLVLSYVLPVAGVLAALGIVYSFDSPENGNHLCKHEYALCTSALCIPQPDDPNKAVCFCDVEEGASLATVPCHTILPSTDSHGIRTVYSTFSMKQFGEGKKSMICPHGTPWTWCLNKKCTVDPTNAKKAICTCDVMRTHEWTTLGGNCDTATCKTGYWSGATMKDINGGSAFLIKKLGLDKSPLKWCPATH